MEQEETIIKKENNEIKIENENTNTNTNTNIIEIEKKLKCLIISDLHEGINNIRLLKKYIEEQKIIIDQLWISGDLVTMKPRDYHNNTKVQEFESVLKEILKTCLEIHPHPIFIPGNHDPDSTLKGSNLDIKDVRNAHKEMLKIDENLYLIGFGGSGPAFQNDKLIWEGYPFNNDQELAKEFEMVIEKYLGNSHHQDKSSSTDSIILMTHTGPTQSSTTMDWRSSDETPIQAGSDSIRNVLLNAKYRDRIIANIHGHIHLGFGQGHIGNIPVINPGSLRGKTVEENRFAIITLTKNKKAQSWQVQSTEYISL